MAQGDIETVERAIAAFSRRDVDAMLAEMHPEIELRPAVIGGLEQITFRGHDGVREFMAGVAEMWREFQVTADEYRDLGDTVLMLGRTLAQGMQSGVELDTASGFVFGIREGKIHRFRSFVTPEAALTAVGLSE